MTAKDFLEEHGIPNMPTQYSPQFQTNVNDTAKALEAYHQEKLKLLGIGVVSNRRELLIAYGEFLGLKDADYTHDDIIEDIYSFLKGN